MTQSTFLSFLDQKGQIHATFEKIKISLILFHKWRPKAEVSFTEAFPTNAKKLLSVHFKESILLDCQSPESPKISVYYFEKDLSMDVVHNGIVGFDYSTCFR